MVKKIHIIMVIFLNCLLYFNLILRLSMIFTKNKPVIKDIINPISERYVFKMIDKSPKRKPYNICPSLMVGLFL